MDLANELHITQLSKICAMQKHGIHRLNKTFKFVPSTAATRFWSTQSLSTSDREEEKSAKTKPLVKPLPSQKRSLKSSSKKEKEGSTAKDNCDFSKY